MHYDRIVIGYHGCRGSVAEKILSDHSAQAFQESQNEYDWLGRGVYFWEYGLGRALQWTTQNYVKSLKLRGGKVPRNSGENMGARRFDCAVINVYLDQLEEEEGVRYDTVRCGYLEGGPVYQDSEVTMGIHRQSHIQIAVRNTDCIIGTFRPRLPR